MRCRKFLSESEVGSIESYAAGYVAWIAESSAVMSEMVEEEDDVGRGGCFEDAVKQLLSASRHKSVNDGRSGGVN